MAPRVMMDNLVVETNHNGGSIKRMEDTVEWRNKIKWDRQQMEGLLEGNIYRQRDRLYSGLSSSSDEDVLLELTKLDELDKRLTKRIYDYKRLEFRYLSRNKAAVTNQIY
jgi:hypothetical protein